MPAASGLRFRPCPSLLRHSAAFASAGERPSRPRPAGVGHRRRRIAPARLGPASALRLERQLALAGALADEARATRRVLLRADWVYDDALVRGLVAAESDLALHAVDGIAVALNVAAADAADAAALLWPAAPRPRPGK